MSAMRILVVEDDRRIIGFLKRGLEAEGFSVRVAEDGREGLAAVREDEIDLIILDRMIPYVDGLELCRIVRAERRSALILMLTAKDGLEDKIQGLRGGADDYLTKPFAFDELLARIEALRRRKAAALGPSPIMRAGELTLDPESRTVTRAGVEISLTVREYDLLHYLMRNAGRALSRERLLNGVWDYTFDPGTKVVDVYVRYLRRKLGDDDGVMIRTLRGVGYMLTKEG
ncbi:MAG TPA: response regulator transcription factor [Hansschlegelia sp.]